MAKRCLIVSYYFPPTGGGGVQRITKLVKFLSQDNWEFVVVTAENERADLPTDSSLMDEIPKSTRVIKVPAPFKRKNDFSAMRIKSNFVIRWLSSLLFIPDARRAWIKPLKKKVVEILDKQTMDALVISSPPYSLAMLAAELSLEIKIPVIADFRDPWTSNPYKIHPTPLHAYIDRKIELNTIKNIHYGVSAYQSLIDFYQKNIAGFKIENWRYIPNGYDASDFKGLVNEKTDRTKLNIAFSGTFYSHINQPEFLFKAIANLDINLRNQVRFHHIGDSVIPLMKSAESFGIGDNLVQWHYQEHKRCLEILAAMDVLCFILDSKNPNARNTIGGKVYEYLYLQKPVLALVPENGEAAELIRQSASGIVIDPYKTKDITALLESWIKEKPTRKNTFDDRNYERFELAQKYGKFIKDVISDYSNT